MKPSRILVYLSLVLSFLAVSAAGSHSLAAGAPTAPLGDDGWLPVDMAQLTLKTPVVERDADAEAIFWEVRLDDADIHDLVLNHYIRIKVFTERGRESQSKIDIPFINNIKIKDIAGRTIRPDGSIVELKKEDVYERTVIRASGLKVKAKSFAMPSVEPGSIIEYRWREVRSNRSANYVRLQFQRDIPVQSVTYYLKPIPNLMMRYHPFHMRNPKFEKAKNGFFSTTLTNMPAFREEPRMPPEDQVRAWILVFYSVDEKLEPAKFWNEMGKRMHDIFKSKIKANDEVRRVAAETIGDAATPEEKLARLFDFCRTKIRNTSDDAVNLTPAEREKLKDNKSPSDTLKRGEGDGGDIDMLFAALATAAGFDARVAWTADRSDIFFDPMFTDPYFLNPSSIAVKVGDGWRFYNPGFNYVPVGMLRWQEEGTQTLITDPKQPTFVTTPLSAAEKSVERRTARLRLDEEGTLEGDVRVEYFGHAGMEMKEEHDEETAEQREESVRADVKRRLSTAEVSDIRLENVNDSVKPFAYTYRVRVPGYAQRTGKRLFLQPAYFQRNVGPLFPTSERRNLVYFHYAWSEQDDVTIELPKGYALDNPDAPAVFGAGDLSRYDVRVQVTPDGSKLIYKRSFFFGGDKSSEMSRLLYPVESYPQLKQYFDEVHKQDNHSLSLKQGASSAPSTSAAKPASN